ncbi:Uncharacterised protein [Pseudomonas fluorescens]|uniref:Uncharacterized protein n=1 Tax=Pseudomonas fluorescens TaxID=294 RepID=A0A3S4T003_PSEFL|nr:Uncharacterised protein [Pseudomonas fluorescens]
MADSCPDTTRNRRAPVGAARACGSSYREGCMNLLRDAARGGDVPGDLPIDVHIACNLGVFHDLAGTFRRWRRCERWRWRRTGTAGQQRDKQSQGQHAFPRIFHRTTRDKGKSHSRGRTDHERPDHSFFIADRPVCASKQARSTLFTCRLWATPYPCQWSFAGYCFAVRSAVLRSATARPLECATRQDSTR